MTAYRREIDGLRALAVLPVIFFHAGFRVFGGGFVGVDVFFVISGYLITGILLAENESGSFSIARFYERRARRILPALFFVMAACLPFAWFWLLPNDMLSFARSVVAVTLFLSNVHFKNESGYFDTAVELKPLLHTWSLSVEEQYYVIFPLFIAVAWRLGIKWLMALLAAVALLSLSAAQLAQAHKPASAYFMLPTRGWELLIGSLTALYARHGHGEQLRRGRCISEVASILGLAMLLYAVLAFDRTTPFPGIYALIPTLGTALIILYCGPHTVVGRLLGSRPFVGIGLISYSAYLWHQPLLAYARYRSLFEPSATLLGGLCMIALVLAWFSWRFVETPFRDKARYSRQQVFAWSLGGSLVLLALGGAGWVFKGFENRPVAEHLPRGYFAQSWIQYDATSGVDGYPCISESGSLCRVNASAGHRKILLLGDSHSADFTSEFRRFVLARQLDAWQMSVGGCAFIPAHFARHDGDCGKARQRLELAIKAIHFDQVIVITNLDEHMAQIDVEGSANGDPRARVRNIEAFTGLLELMLGQGAKVDLFTPRPTFDASPTRAAALRKFGDLHVVSASSHAYVGDAFRAMQAKQPGLRVFDQYDTLLRAGCGQASCFTGHTAALQPLYRDAGHLTSAGAKLVFDEYLALW
ncbi:MAG: acyltransferase [Aquabacterium sp.]|uniref:acyltransferase family protein n=1 Tax=Aquabacterium sp. TaxID=1872578 RepID=UPI00120637B6|nr:acyltransferase family protein [Aquabacterium sp.]TAK94912.1 MAG: acyltransferase [Aquabacterium sp.]